MKSTLTLMAALLLVTALGSPLLAENTPAAVSPATATETAGAAPDIDPAAYPLQTCIVTGEKLGEMGEPVSKLYDGREVKFCCKMCVKSFEKDQEKWMKKLDEAIIAVQAASYPLETCVVSGEKLGGMGEPVNYVYKNQLVKLCCKGCIPALQKEPEKYLRALSAGNATE